MSRSLDDKLVGNILEHVPLIGYIQSRFSIDSALKWLEEYWYISIIASLIYIIFLWLGRQWMSKRPAYDLRRPLFMWNVGLAVFSVLGMVSMAPNLVHRVVVEGIHYSACHADTLVDPHQAVWGFVFVLSKVLEFGDTIFIVLRKSPLMFLHWYHHVTVCVYSWYGLGHSSNPVGAWFGSMNYTVHSFMYSYYALRAARVRVSSYVAQGITLMQISQMFMGLYINVMNYVQFKQLGGEVCECNENVFKIGLIIYGSYALLFLKYFYDRYCSKKVKQQ